MMKRVLKIMGYIFLAIVLLIILLLVKAAKTPFVPEDYCKTVSTGGEIESKYIQMGGFEVSYKEVQCDEVFQKYVIYYPTELEDIQKQYPVVIYANGTGVKASKYPKLFEHLASWGFIVVGNEDEESWTGISSNKSLEFILSENEKEESVFYQKVDTENIGISGHSQGGVGVFNAITEHNLSDRYKTAVALSPTHEEQAISVKWHYDLTKIQIPLFMLAGTKGDFETKLVIPYEKMLQMFGKLSGDKVMARKTGYEHGQMLYEADGYVTAWFMWQLQGDEEAAKAFIGENPELINNTRYQDQQMKLLDYHFE